MVKKRDITYISNDAKRKATLRKRKNGLFKKVDELSTLCGIEACAMIHNPEEPQLEVWPSPSGARRVISKFNELPEPDQSKNMLTQESYLEEMIQKVEEQLEKQRIENRNKELNDLMIKCLDDGQVPHNTNTVDLNDLSRLIDLNLMEIDLRINRTKGQEGASNGVLATNGDQA